MIPFDDRGLLLGDGLFETLLAVDGRIEAFEAHIDRMVAGCAVLGLTPPSEGEARRLCVNALAEANLERGRAAVRLTLTAGSGGRGLARPAPVSPRLFATAAPTAPAGQPVELVTVRTRRNDRSPASRLKSLAYLDNILARNEAGGAEALMLNTRDEVACADVGNLFWLEGEVIHTPALACGVLAGIIRTRVLLVAARRGLAVVEIAAPRARLDSARAIVVTNSLGGARPVIRLDGAEVHSQAWAAELNALIS